MADWYTHNSYAEAIIFTYSDTHEMSSPNSSNSFHSFRECLRCNILHPRDCTIISRMEPKQVTISKPSQSSGQDSTMWIIVCTSPHWHLSVGAMCHCHLCRLAAQRPCPVRKRFCVDHIDWTLETEARKREITRSYIKLWNQVLLGCQFVLTDRD